jgi:hypothetical protein
MRGRYHRRLRDAGMALKWGGCAPVFNKTVQRMGASQFAQEQIERHRLLVPVADLIVIAKERYVACTKDAIWRREGCVAI